jgi:hypothetical protein
MPQTEIHPDAPAALALAAFGIRCLEHGHVGIRIGLGVGDVAVQQDKTLLAQKEPIRRPKPIALTIWTTDPRAELSPLER